MNILVRAIITGFGLRIGAELGKFVSKKAAELFPDRDEDEADPAKPPAEDGEGEGEEDEDALPGTSPDPPEM